MKKILLVLNTGLENAGVPTVIMNIVENLKDEVTFDILVCDTKECYYDDDFLKYGGKIFRINLIKYTDHKIIFPVRGLKIFRSVYNISKKNGPYHAIHCHDGLESGISLLAAQLTGVKLKISHCHGKYRSGGKNLFLRVYYFLCRELISKFSEVKLTCSNEAGFTLFGKDDSVINLINPVDINKYKNISRSKGDNNLNMLQIGYFSQNKNQLFSLKILKKLIEKKSGVHMYFIGFENEDGYHSKMLSFINDNFLENNVTFLKHSHNKEEVFPKTDLLLLPSYSEASPLVLLEAQSANINCIASNNVPRDVNLGLCNYISLQNENLWVKKILELEGSNLTVDEKKLEKVDIKNYIENIKSIYQLPPNDFFLKDEEAE